eukprot:364999-Chlamydomonas_euryale.AAC.7
MVGGWGGATWHMLGAAQGRGNMAHVGGSSGARQHGTCWGQLRGEATWYMLGAAQGRGNIPGLNRPTELAILPQHGTRWGQLRGEATFRA